LSTLFAGEEKSEAKKMTTMADGKKKTSAPMLKERPTLHVDSGFRGGSCILNDGS